MREGSWRTAVAGGAIAFPIAVLLHELGHFAGYSVFGFPDPVLRFASTGWADVQFDALIAAGDVEAAAAIAQPWQVAVAGAAGPIVSYLIVIACVLAVRRFGPGPFSLVLGVGLVSPLRWLPAIPLLAVKLVGVQWTTGMDEAKLAERTGIPVRSASFASSMPVVHCTPTSFTARSGIAGSQRRGLTSPTPRTSEKGPGPNRRTASTQAITIR